MRQIKTKYTSQKMKFPIKNFFSKCDQICRRLRIWSHLLKNSFVENFFFCAMIFLDMLLATRLPHWFERHEKMRIFTEFLVTLIYHVKVDWFTTISKNYSAGDHLWILKTKKIDKICLIIKKPMLLLHRNQSTDVQCKSNDRFQSDNTINLIWFDFLHCTKNEVFH